MLVVSCYFFFKNCDWNQHFCAGSQTFKYQDLFISELWVDFVIARILVKAGWCFPVSLSKDICFATFLASLRSVNKKSINCSAKWSFWPTWPAVSEFLSFFLEIQGVFFSSWNFKREFLKDHWLWSWAGYFWKRARMLAILPVIFFKEYPIP